MWAESERRRTLIEAHRSRTQGDERRAISLYKRILREEPENFEVAVRVAPLLAARGDRFEAWQLYRGAARQLARARRYKDCLAVYTDACRHVPMEFDVWRLRAELELMMGRDDSAFETLLDGRVRFTDAHNRAQAIALLSRARMIDPQDSEVALDLAELYARTDQADAAIELLLPLSIQGEPNVMRRARALQWRITLAPRHALLWLQACWRGVAPERQIESIGPGSKPLAHLDVGVEP
jgi:thioredoxin-like negative regulator of GroEL